MAPVFLHITTFYIVKIITLETRFKRLHTTSVTHLEEPRRVSKWCSQLAMQIFCVYVEVTMLAQLLKKVLQGQDFSKGSK